MAVLAAVLGVVITSSSVIPQSSPPVRQVVSAADLAPLIFAGQQYVALGSSYAAGPELTTPPNPCQRARDNYPHQVAHALGMRLADVTCSGSRTAHILRIPQRPLAAHRQIDAVTPDTRLVTITTGGNDIGYIGRLLALGCLNATPGSLAPATAAACARGRTVRPEPTAAGYTAVERSIVAIIDAVRMRAPRALVVVVDYLPVLGPHDRSCPGLALTSAEAAAARRVFDGLAAATARAATNGGANLIPASRLGRMHGVCSAAPWISGFGRGSASYHPNLAGKTALADAVLRLLRQPAITAKALALSTVPLPATQLTPTPPTQTPPAQTPPTPTTIGPGPGR